MGLEEITEKYYGENEDESELFTSDDVVKEGDDIRKRILDGAQIDLSKISPNFFDYTMHRNDAGLNDISNVGIGQAGAKTGSHVAKRGPYLNELEYNIKLMENSPNAILVLNGNLFSYIPKSQKNAMLSYKDQVAYFYSLLKDVAKQGKILALVRGTDEHWILKNHNQDLLGILQESLGLKGKVCNDAYINLHLKDDLVGDAQVGIKTINWQNNATTGGYIGRKMEERATKNSGADIYLARTVLNYFKIAEASESIDGQKCKKPIYLISAGPYTRYKGSIAAGAEYNSVKDNELAPNSYWYKISVEENSNKNNASKPYEVKVNPIGYMADSILYKGTDTVTAKIERAIEDATGRFVSDLVDNFPTEKMTKSREDGTEVIRETLFQNERTAEKNSAIKNYLDSKKSVKDIQQTCNDTMIDETINAVNDESIVKSIEDLPTA